MSQHFDEGDLARYREGLLRRRTRARLSAHLAQCPQCAETDALLAAMPAVLADTPVPAMPPAVAARLDAALAAEVARAGVRTPARGGDAASWAGRGGPGGGSGPRRASRARRPRGPAWVLRIATAAAAVALLGGGGYAVSRAVPLIAGSSAGSPAGSAAPGMAGQDVPASAPPAAAPRQSNQAATGTMFPLVSSGTDYRPGTLASQVQAVLARYPQPGHVPAPTGGGEAASTLRGCVSRVTGHLQPVLVDAARYAGRPATVIVVTDGQSRIVWVVGSGCTARNSDVITRLVLPTAG